MRLLIFIISLILTTSVYAEEKEKTVEEHCKGWYRLATVVMTYRVNNTPIVSLMEAMKGDNEKYQFIVTRAYSQPSMLTEEGKKRQIIDFGNDTYLECLKANGKG
jgi:hypothetical protein